MSGKPEAFPDPLTDVPLAANPMPLTLVVAGGCFWCVEAVFRQIEGVLAARSGYAGGTAATANYRAVCGGATDHAEAVEIEYDAGRVTLGRLLKVFFATAHDPTQLDRQGNDRGRQYRSSVFYANPEQREIAAAYIRQLDDAHVLSTPIVTRLEPLDIFYEAEDYHQDYAARNPDQPYIAAISTPKVEKTRQYFCGLGKGSV